MIYKATNNINGMVYIGQTTGTLGKRKLQHKNTAKRGDGYHLHRAIRKYGFDNFYWMILNQCDDINTLNLLEQYYIACYNSMEEGYNMSIGGGSGIGYKHTESAKKQMSIKQLGKKNHNWGKRIQCMEL